MKSEVENVENKVSRTGETSDVLLENTVPQAEYMYGCTPTALAMLLGYYDLYGYADGTALSNLIAGNITVDSRGTDGSAYNMNAFDTVLGSFTASEEYVYRFFSRDDTDSVTVGDYTATTPAQELAYSFVNGGTELDTSSWNCLADYIGTGQYWRGNDNLSTTVHYSTLEEIVNRSSTVTITSGSTSRTIDYKYTTMLYGLELYVRSRGYQLDYEITGTYAADVNGGSFTFEDYMAEIDAGRAVLVSIEGHSMVGYGYNAASREIIFDDTYTANQSMVWDGMYFYSGENRSLKSITVIGFKTSGSDVDLGFAESAGGDEVILATVEAATSSQTCLYAGDTLYLSFSVKNLLSDASGAFDVGIYINGTKVRNITVNGIAGNSVQEFTDIEIGTVAAGHHSLKVVIDDGNRIQESSGANNEFEQAFQVLQSGAVVISGSSSIVSGTTLDHAYITSGGRLYVVGGSANAPEVMGNSGGYAYVYASAGGVVKDAAIMEYGYGVARSGGVLESAVVSSRGQLTVSSGGSTLGNRIAGGSQFVYSGGVVENTVISGGYMSVRGGIARNTEVYDSLYCSSAATLVSGVTVHESGFLRVYSSAVASDVDLNGSATIGYGGQLYDARLSSGASMTLSSGGSAIGVTASGAWINLSSGGVVSNAVLNNNGSMSLRNGAVSSDTKVAQGGVIYCWTSGSLKGTLDIAGEVQDASTAAVSGVTAYNFELNAQRDAAFLEFTTGGIQSGAVITVDVSNGWGSYLLVDGDVSNISSASITVKSGQYSANAVVGGSAVTLEDGRTVALSVNDSGLLAQVSGSDNVAPAAPSNLQKQLAGNLLSLSWTAVSDFSGVSYVIEYADNAAFTNAVSVSAATNHAEVRMPNGDWYIRVKSVDGAGNQSAWSSAGTQSVNYVEEISGSHASTVTVENDVNLLYGASVTASFPAALNVLGDNFTVNLAGGNTLSCSGIRNAAILFGEDAYWPNGSGNPHYSGSVNFNGENISLYSDVGSCITAAGIVGYDLNVAFTGDAEGSESITFEATNRAGAPGNFAGAIIADNDLVITGEFAGSINSHFDFSDVAVSNMRSASVYGFSAGNDLIINDDFSADIFACAVSDDGAYAYGLDAANDLVVSGEISGIIAACGNDVARAVDGNNVSITVSGTLFAGKSADGNDMETMNGKLENFAANKDELLSLRHTGGYAVYAYGTGTLNFKGDALSIGKIYVRNSASVITVSDAARLYGDISVGSSGVSLVFKLNDRSLDGTRVVSSAWNRYVNITVDGSSLISSGTYKLVEADSLSTISKIALTVGGNTQDLTVDESVTVGNTEYSLAKITAGDKTTLTLTVTEGSVPGVSNLTGNANGVSWNGNGSAFVVEYSKDNFASVLQLETATSAVDTYQIGAGSWKVRVDSEAQTGFTAAAPTGSAAQVVSDADGNLDVFFARTAGTWDAKHLAKHLGDFNGWQGTKERVALTGKNIITDVFAGSSDANVLVLTDDANGDALFLDDMYSALGNQARLGNIDEIRAGAGNDVIDLTSPKFAYLGDEMTVFGGSGDDTIWANSGVNTLYGDAGNDRIIGGSGNDFIIGGAGNDTLHGGGGNDTFCFGANWGTDTVEQLANGKVILRFETGSMSNWNAAAKTYTNGSNTVTVTGTSDIELYFGTAPTLPQDAFAPASSEKIFEQLA